MPHLRRGFEDAVFVYLPSVFPLHFPIRGGAAVITGTAPTSVNLNGNVSTQIPNVGVTSYISASAGTQALDFSTSGFTCLVVGSYYNTNGTQPIETLIRRNGDGAGNGGFTTTLYNSFGGTPASVFCSYDKPGTGDSNYDSVWVNGVKATTGNGDPGTAVNTRYVLAVNTATGPGTGGTTEFILGRGTGAQDSSSNIEFAIVFPRKLPEPLMRQLTLDPYFVFEPAADLTFLSAPAADYVPYATPAQLMSQPASSYAPMMRFASVAATALAVVAGTYVPSGPVAASPARQAQIAYREPARLTTQIKPVVTVGPTIGPTAPIGSTSALQTQIAYRESSRLPQSILPNYSPGETPPYALSPVLVPVVEPPWPYAKFVTFPNFSPGITPPYAFSPAINPVRQPPWSYASLIPATPPNFTQGAGYAFALPVQPVRVPDWPYASAVAIEQQPAATQSIVSQIPYQPLPPIVQAAWGYQSVVDQTTGIATINPPLIGPQAPPTPVRQWLVQPPYPHAATMMGAPTASLWGQAAYLAPTPALVPVRVPEWSYAATMLPSPTASEWKAGPPAYFGIKPVVQWLSYPPWPYSATMVPKPTASQFGVAPPTPIVPAGSNGLRRWAIQQYEAYFTQRDQMLAKAAKEKLESQQVQLPRKIRRLSDAAPPILRDDEMDAAFRLVNQLSAGAISLNVRLTTLEQQAKATPAFPKVTTPSAQQVVNQDDEDLLLLAILYGDSIWQKKL